MVSRKNAADRIKDTEYEVRGKDKVGRRKSEEFGIGFLGS
jgi:hypothetical protein